MKNLVLIGMMGSAKTTTGKIIAKKLNRPFFDGDEVYVSLYKEKITETFEKFGEKEFRLRETEVYKVLGALDGAVIACGGGVVLNPENMAALKQKRNSGAFDRLFRGNMGKSKPKRKPSARARRGQGKS